MVWQDPAFSDVPSSATVAWAAAMKSDSAGVGRHPVRLLGRVCLNLSVGASLGAMDGTGRAREWPTFRDLTQGIGDGARAAQHGAPGPLDRQLDHELRGRAVGTSRCARCGLPVLSLEGAYGRVARTQPEARSAAAARLQDEQEHEGGNDCHAQQ